MLGLITAFNRDCRMLVLDLGELSIVTEKPQLTLSETDGAAAVCNFR